MRQLVALLFCALAATTPQPAAAAPQSAPVQPAPVQPALPAPVEYQVGPGDRLSIRVAGVREFDITARISNSGRVHIPYVGVMFVAGMTTVALESQIARLITERELVNEPSVRVQVDEFRAQPAYVIGDVNVPGQFVITGEMYLLDVLSKAGGLMPSAADVGFLYRRQSLQPGVERRVIGGAVPLSDGEESVVAAAADAGEPQQEVVEVNLEELRAGTRPELNVQVRGGDILFVPRRQQQNVFIVGDVITPGVYSLPRRGTMTAVRALIYAGGPLPTAKTGSAFIMRHDETGTRVVIPFDFSKIMQGEEPDVTILANDILYVPTSNMKMIGLGFVNLVPRLLQQFLIF